MKPTLIQYKITKVQYNLYGRTNLQYWVCIVPKDFCLFFFCQKLNSNSAQKRGPFKGEFKVGARPAGASTLGVEQSLEGVWWPLALILFACALVTPSTITGPLARASHPDRCSAGCARERGCSSHAARIARSNAVPRIERVPCLLCPVCLCYRA